MIVYQEITLPMAKQNQDYISDNTISLALDPLKHSVTVCDNNINITIIT